MTLFHLQLILSFLVGGIAIATLSYIAEKVPKALAGVVLPLPSTVAISYLFIAIVLSTDAISLIAPTTVLATAVVLLFTLVYLFLARIPKPKNISMLLAGLGSLAVWFVLSVPMAVFEFSNMTIAILGYAICTILGYSLLTKNTSVIDIPTPNVYGKRAITLRALVGGSIVMVAVLLAKVAGPFWGGIFTGFPAVFLSTLVILHYYHSPAFLIRTFHNVPLGLIVTVTFPLVAQYTFPKYGILSGFIISYFVAVLVAILIFHATKK